MNDDVLYILRRHNCTFGKDFHIKHPTHASNIQTPMFIDFLSVLFMSNVTVQFSCFKCNSGDCSYLCDITRSYLPLSHSIWCDLFFYQLILAMRNYDFTFCFSVSPLLNVVFRIFLMLCIESHHQSDPLELYAFKDAKLNSYLLP